MNAQDNIRGLLTRGDFERVGCFEHFWPGTLKAWLDQGYPYHVETVDGIETKVADEHLFAHFDLDTYMCGGWFDVDPIQEITERQVIDLVEGMKTRNAHFVFHTDHSVTPNARYDSYRYALDVYREHAWY